MSDLARDVASEVIRIYQEIDGKRRGLQAAAGIRCPPGCGACCESPEVEATVPEALPLAMEIYRRKQEEAVLWVIEESENRGDLRCVLYRSGPGAGRGACSYYDFRPLVCRLFGFASRRNKQRDLEFCACWVIRERTPEAVRRAEIEVFKGLDVPVYQESFMRIASMTPGMGYRRLPINRVLKEALEQLYWRRAGSQSCRKQCGRSLGASCWF